MGVLATADRAAGGLAWGLGTLGQVGLVCLGVHLAADALDDRVLHGLQRLEEGLDDTLGGPLGALAAALEVPGDTFVVWGGLARPPLAACGALVVELVTIVLLCGSFLLTGRAERPTLRGWWAARSVGALVLPLSLAGVLGAGGWSLAMAVEDQLPAGPVARVAAALFGLAAALRFGLPAWCRAVAALDPPARRAEGLLPALVLAPIGLLAWMDGWPVWGLLGGWLP